MKATIAEVKNIRRIRDTAHELAGRPSHLPGIGLLHGASGHGKTTAAAWLATDPGLGVVYVRASVTWTPNSLLTAVLRELGAETRASGARLLQLVQEAAEAQGKSLLIVDEADYLATGASQRMAETLRDLHDVSGIAILLVAMKRLTLSAQLTGRISHWLAFDPADPADTALLAQDLCEVGVELDLVQRLHDATKGSVRGIVVGLSRIEAFGIKSGLESVDAATWGNRPFTLGGGR